MILCCGFSLLHLINNFHGWDLIDYLHFFLYLSSMKIARKIVALVLLAIYGLVMLHDFLPHHHHSELQEYTHTCYFEEHQHLESDTPGIFNEHHDDHHLACHFNGKILPAKVLSLSVVYFIEEQQQFIAPESEQREINTDSTPRLRIEFPGDRLSRRGPPSRA